MRRPRTSLAILLVIAGVARADSFGDAVARGDIDALEAIGSGPQSRWTDNAWREAARLAEKANDYARARRDLERAIAADDDDVARRRDQADLARITARTGGGRWDSVVAAHERIEARMLGGGDPKPAIAELERLVLDNPDYPRRTDAQLAIALAQERDGDATGAVATLRAAHGAGVQVALTRALIRHGDLDDAERELASVEPTMRTVLAGELAEARWRSGVRVALWIALAVIAVAVIVSARRDWRRLLRPPPEVLFFAPISAVLAIVASTGNPLVARAVRTIAVGGGAVAWISGALLAGRPVRARRAVTHAVIATFVVAAIVYLAIDRDYLFDLVGETWREGPQMR